MTEPLPPWRPLRVDGERTVIEVDVEPGRTTQLPILTRILGTSVGDEVIRLRLRDHAERADALGDFT